MPDENSSVIVPNQVLVVEDEKSLSDSLALKFNSLDFQATVVENGLDVEKTVIDKKFDIILLDIMLPDKDGYEVLKTLKNNPDTKDIPVIMLTNLGDMASMERCLNLGANDYCIKTNTSLDELELILHKFVVSFNARQNLHKE